MEEFIKFMRESGYCEYGAVVSGAVVREVLGIHIEGIDTYAEFLQAQQTEKFKMLALKDILLNEGKYLKQDGDLYRVLLPSENLAQVARYEEGANAKLRRGRLLLSNTPPKYRGDTHRDAMNQARLHAKATQRKRGKV